MSLAFDTAGDNQIDSGIYGAQWLLTLDFDPTPLYLTTAPVDVDYDGDTYLGLGKLLEISAVTESEDAGAEKIKLSIPITDSSMLAACLGSVASYRGRSVVLRLQLFSETFAPVGDPVTRWTGYMDPVQIDRQGSGGRITLPCNRAGMARARHYQGLRHTHAQQLQRYSGDLGLAYMQDLIEHPALWLSKEFQRV